MSKRLKHTGGEVDMNELVKTVNHLSAELGKLYAAHNDLVGYTSRNIDSLAKGVTDIGKKATEPVLAITNNISLMADKIKSLNEVVSKNAEVNHKDLQTLSANDEIINKQLAGVQQDIKILDQNSTELSETVKVYAKLFAFLFPKMSFLSMEDRNTLKNMIQKTLQQQTAGKPKKSRKNKT